MTTRIKLRRDTAANWTSADPVLALGEAGYDTTNNELRVGDGVSTWGNLSAIGGGISSNRAIDPELADPVTFARPENVATDAEGAVDAIDTGVSLGRNNSAGGLLNTLEDSLDGWNNGNYSGQPTYTEWNTDGWGDLTDVANRSYDNFKNMKQGLPNNDIVGVELVMHDTLNDKYYTFKFSRWSVYDDGGRGGFSYVRRLINHTAFFTKDDYDTNHTDSIGPGLTIKRNNNQGIYNAEEEGSYGGDSPYGTLWNIDGWGDLSNLLTRTYTTWASAFSYQVGNRIVGTEAIMHDTINDNYYAVKFTDWTQGNNGGGFRWSRRLIDITKLNEGLHFADGTVQLTAATGSGSADRLTKNQHSLVLNNNGVLLGGTDGTQDIEIGQDSDNEVYRAHVYISQDNPYIRSEVISTTNQNYVNDMLWHDAWFSRYNKLTTDAYGVHIKNAQWSGPANEYHNIWTFTKDGIFDLPPRAEIRANPWPQYYGGGASYPVPDDNYDQSLTLTANSVMISGGRLDVAGGAKDGWIASLGPFPNTENSYWYEATDVDAGGNVYAAGGSYDTDHHSIVTKFLANGDIAWNKYIDYDGSAWAGEPNSITYNSQTDQVYLTTNYYYDTDYVAIFALDANTGAVTTNGTITNSEPWDIEAIDVCSAPFSSGAPIVVGRRANGRAYFTPYVSGITQTTTRLVVAAQTFNEGLTPDSTQGAWYMFGTGITGNVAISSINNFQGVTATRVSGSGPANAATFSVFYTPGQPYVDIGVWYPGGGYANDDVLKITGDQLGGTTPENDLTFHVVTDGGYISSFNTITGDATTNYALGLSGDPADFTSIATPTILAYTSTDGFMQINGSTYIMGNVSWDVINTITNEYESTDGNVYIGGRTHAQGYTTNRQAFVSKFCFDGEFPIWSVVVDDYTAQNGTERGGEVLGIVSDSAKAVIAVAVNNNGNITVTKVSTDGVMEWQRILSIETDLDQVYGIALGDDDSVLVTARYSAYQNQNNQDLLITKIDKNGNQLWTRGFGTMQSDGSLWNYNFRDITVSGSYYIINGWTNGVANQRFNNSNGFVAKFPLDGTGVGRYDDFYYQQLDGVTYFETVANTAANAFTISMRTVTSTPENFVIGSLSPVSSEEENADMLRVSTGGPGVIQGVNEVRFTDGTAITHGHKVSRYTSTADGTDVGATVIDPTSTKVFLAGGAGIAASYLLDAGLYDGQQIQFFPQGKIATTGISDIQNVRVYLPNPYHPDSNADYNTGVWPYYPFTHINDNSRNSLATATWNAVDEVWVLDPWDFD